MSELEKFLEERSKVPIPSGDVARVKLLAKELALGLHRGLWDDYIGINPHHGPNQESLQRLWNMKWNDYDFGHSVELLEFHGFVQRSSSAYILSGSSVQLLDEAEPYNIFISYRRLDSSALALLVLAQLKEHDLIPFLDMALEAGGKWHTDLEARIKENDYFIILLGKETLASPMTIKEIEWALKYEKTIIPVWHSGFDISDEKWKEVPDNVMDAIQQTNAIRVTDESASGYNTAIVELLNRFGITP